MLTRITVFIMHIHRCVIQRAEAPKKLTEHRKSAGVAKLLPLNRPRQRQTPHTPPRQRSLMRVHHSAHAAFQAAGTAPSFVAEAAPPVTVVIGTIK